MPPKTRQGSSGGDYPLTFVRGRRIQWGALASVLVGGPVYAWYVGLIGSLDGFGDWIQTGLDGVRTFAVGILDGMFTSAATAISQSWWSYWSVARSTFGLGSWFVTVAVVILVMWLVLVGVRRFA